MNKVVAYFTNDRGEYYLENIHLYNGTFEGHGHEPAMTIDESEDWQRYSTTKLELRSPTTNDGDVLAIIQNLGSSY